MGRAVRSVRGGGERVHDGEMWCGRRVVEREREAQEWPRMYVRAALSLTSWRVACPGGDDDVGGR